MADNYIYQDYLAQQTTGVPVNLPFPSPVSHGMYQSQRMTPYPTSWPNAHLGNPGGGMEMVIGGLMGFGVNFITLLVATKLMKLKIKPVQVAAIAGITTGLNLMVGMLLRQVGFAGVPARGVSGFGEQYY